MKRQVIVYAPVVAAVFAGAYFELPLWLCVVEGFLLGFFGSALSDFLKDRGMFS